MAISERELTANQRNLVDTCFEEGNYDAAISLVDKLRHPKYKPYPVHIRNLVYIALYPPQSDEPDEAASNLDVLNGSPSKLTARTHNSFPLTPAHSFAAQRVLKAFAQTNSAASICRALPSYATAEAVQTDNKSSWLAELGDSEISRRSRRITEAKNCWELLKPDFVKTEAVADSHSAPSSKPRRTRRSNYAASNAEETVGVDAVGPLAWPLLEWLLTIFEKDEASSAGSDHIRYSPLLLSQIPPSRSPSGSRWDVDAPLNVAFYCLHDPVRSGLGSRLLILLINLASTTYVDLALFLNLTCNRMLSLSPAEIQTIFSLLPSTQQYAQFKVALCKNYLSRLSDTKPVRKPTSRAAPRPQPARARQASAQDSNLKTSTPSESSTLIVARKYPIVTTSEILQLMSCNDTTPDAEDPGAALTLQFKFQLLSAFGTLQEQQSPKDADWERVIHSGELSQAVEQGFCSSEDGPPEVLVWAQDLKSILAAMGWYR